jgi:hypothetical protein
MWKNTKSSSQCQALRARVDPFVHCDEHEFRRVGLLVWS